MSKTCSALLYNLHCQTDEARALANLAGRSQVNREDVVLAAKYSVNQVHANPPPRALALQVGSKTRLEQILI